MKIEQTTLTPELKKEILAGFSEHSAKQGIENLVDKEETVFIIQEKGKFIGAVIGKLFYGQLHIKNLLVSEKFRGQGIGRQLMAHISDYAIKRGASLAYVESFNFQAPEFYKKLGFKIDFIRPGYAQNTSLYYMSKSLGNK